MCSVCCVVKLKCNSWVLCQCKSWNNLISGLDPQKALLQAEKATEHVRSELNDEWDFHGLYSGNGYELDGFPWCTSHYAFHMVLWHIPFAISGQSFSAQESKLSFEPKLCCPYNVPFQTSFASGTLQCTFVHKRNQNKMRFQILSTSSSVFLKQLAVSGFRYSSSALTLKQDEVLTWFSN